MKFGIKFQLFLAFSTAAVLATVGSLYSWSAFSDLSRIMNQITARSIPAMTDSLRLAEQSAALAASAPTLASAKSQADRQQVLVRLQEQEQILSNLISAIEKTSGKGRTWEAINENGQRIVAALTNLNSSVESRLGIQDRRKAMTASILIAHEKFLETLAPLVDDANFDLVISSEEASTKNQDSIAALIDGGAERLRTLLEVMAEGNLLAGLLTEAMNAGNAAVLQPIRERFVASTVRMQEGLGRLPSNDDITPARRNSDKLIAYGNGKRNVFDFRSRELRDGLSQAKERRALLDNIAESHRTFLDQLSPLVDDANFNLVLESEETAGTSAKVITGLIEGGVSGLRDLMEIQALGNLLVGLLSESAGAASASLLGPIEERFRAGVDALNKILPGLPQSPENALLLKSINELTKFGQGKESIFSLRRQELGAMSSSLALLDNNRELASALSTNVRSLVQASQAEVDSGSTAATVAIGSSKGLTLGIALVIVVSALLIGWLYVGRYLMGRLTQLNDNIRALADGKLTERLPIPRHIDEIGEIAVNVNTMANNLTRTVITLGLQSDTLTACTKNLLTVKNSLTQDSHRSRVLGRDAVDENAQLNGEITQIKSDVDEASDKIDSISIAADDLAANINTISAATEEASSNVARVAMAAKRMSESAYEVSGKQALVAESATAVASAIEEMTASLEEVQKRCTSANRESEHADQLARGTHQAMETLSLGSQEIGQVVDVINSIAEQTNMLALNAAIEAAGAGEAGKGFAVVANEVKDLARQTAEATQMIADKIEGIQSNTSEASDNATAIANIINSIYKANKEITLSVEEQTATISEIARSMAGVRQAADDLSASAHKISDSTQEVARSSEEVSEGINEIVRSTSEVASLAEDVATQSTDARTLAQNILDSATKTDHLSARVREKMHTSYHLATSMDGTIQFFGTLASLVEGTARGLREARSGLEVKPPPFDIEEVKNSHLAIVGRFYAACRGRVKTSESDFPDEHSCSFGKWIEGDGQRLFGSSTRFRDLQAVHVNIHRMVKDSANFAIEDKAEEDMEQCAEISSLQKELLELVDHLFMESLSVTATQT